MSLPQISVSTAESIRKQTSDGEFEALRSIFSSCYLREGVLNVDGALTALSFSQLETLPSFTITGHAPDLLMRVERSGKEMNLFLLCLYHSLKGNCYLHWGGWSVMNSLIINCITPALKSAPPPTFTTSLAIGVARPEPHAIYEGQVDFDAVQFIADNPKLSMVVLLRFFRIDLLESEKALTAMKTAREKAALANPQTTV